MRAIVVVACLLLPAAADAAEPTQADQLFAEGRELLEKGRFAEACEKLRQSNEASPAIGTLINLGYCYEQIARFRSAMNAYAEAESLAKNAKDEKREKFSRERFATVAARAVKLIVRVADDESTGIEVRRNNVVVPPTEWGQPVAVDPEDFVITASAPGRLPWRAAVIGRGEGAVITVVIPALEETRVTDRVAGARGALSSLGPKRLAALGLGGVALGTLGAGFALGLSASARYEDSLAHCVNDLCDAQGVSEQQGAVAQGNVATVFVVVGALCIGAGAYLWLTGEEAAKTARWRRPGAFVW